MAELAELCIGDTAPESPPDFGDTVSTVGGLWLGDTWDKFSSRELSLVDSSLDLLAGTIFPDMLRCASIKPNNAFSSKKEPVCSLSPCSSKLLSNGKVLQYNINLRIYTFHKEVYSTTC